MELIDFIKVYDNALTEEECHKCIQIFEAGEVGSGKDKFNNHTQKFTQYWISESEYLQFFEHLKNKMTKCHIDYASYLSARLDYGAIFPPNYVFEPFKIKKYEPKLKDEFRKHTDTSTKTTSKRFLSTLVYLNDVEEGGQTVFNDVAINPRQGRLVLFPPLWLFPHSGRIPISNIKYLLTTYLRYSV